MIQSSFIGTSNAKNLTDSEEEQCWTQNEIDSVLGVPPDWNYGEPDIFIYIDDANGVEKVRVPGSVVTISERKQETRVHAQRSEELLRTISLRASQIKMKVNHAKTQLLCVSASNSAEVSTYIKCGNTKIASTSR